MPDTTILDDLDQVERYLRQDPYLHLYGLGDLDARFRPCTTWYGLLAGENLETAALLYRATDPPALLALGEARPASLRLLLREILPSLPARIQCHLSPGLVDVLGERYQLSAPVPHLKMGLVRLERLTAADGFPVSRLSEADADDLLELYGTAYPDNAYDPGLLATGCFRGIRREGRLVSAAGVHVYSARYRVAALGSIATHPLHRGQGMARSVAAALCRDLLPDVDHVGLNVRADNDAAIACYRAIGFEITHRYVELEAREYGRPEYTTIEERHD